MSNNETTQDVKREIFFYKGEKNIFDELQKEKNHIESIKKEICKIFSSSHLSFVLGAGCSYPAIYTMKEMWGALFDEETGQFIKDTNTELVKDVLEFNEKEKNLEKLLEVLLAKQFYIRQTQQNDNEITNTINEIKKYIFDRINVDKQTDQEKLYKSFYKKLMYRENTLSKINIFTTNYDLFNEKAMDDLGIIYCNGFSGGINRYFNPMTFNYAYAEQIGLNNNKYNVLDKYVYLYKLHGSISWVEDENSNSLFKVKEVQSPSFTENKNILIYPTPTKQNSSFASPYSDLFREFQKKLLQQDNILVVIGYSFSDEHINNIIYQALATIPKFRLIIFSFGKIEGEIEKLRDFNDPRIWIIGEEERREVETKNIASFEYIINNFLLDENEEDTKIEQVLKEYIKETNT